MTHDAFAGLPTDELALMAWDSLLRQLQTPTPSRSNVIETILVCDLSTGQHRLFRAKKEQ